MSIAHKLEARGEQRGLEAGLQKGLQEGRQEGLHLGRMKVIRELLASGTELEDLKKNLKITEEEIRLLVGSKAT